MSHSKAVRRGLCLTWSKRQPTRPPAPVKASSTRPREHCAKLRRRPKRPRQPRSANGEAHTPPPDPPDFDRAHTCPTTRRYDSSDLFPGVVACSPPGRQPLLRQNGERNFGGECIGCVTHQRCAHNTDRCTCRPQAAENLQCNSALQFLCSCKPPSPSRRSPRQKRAVPTLAPRA